MEQNAAELYSNKIDSDPGQIPDPNRISSCEVHMRSIFAILLLSCACGANTAAQSKKPVEPAPNLSLTAVGRQHHGIQTRSREAQDFFDQGVTLLYGFNHEEAARAFQRAAEFDPSSPMPLWGIAMAVGPNYNMDVDAEREKLAYETVQKAQKLAERAPQVEKDYVAAIATRYSGDAAPDYKKLSRDFAAAMKGLSQEYPDDLDAATFYAESLMDLNPWKLWTHDGKPNEGTEEIVRVLESVLQRDPNHAGANHYYIHAVEASPHPERALPSARRLDAMVPQAGHLVHMPAHIYIRTGDYAAAVKNNAEAAQVDQVYAQKAEKEGSIYDLMYHSHNEHFLASAASMAGRYAEAKMAAEGLAKRLEPHAKMMPMLDGFFFTPFWVDARFAKWDAILKRPEPPKELPGTHAMWRYSRALAFAARGEGDKAGTERDLLSAEASAFAAEANFGGFNTARDVLGLALEVVDARIAAARGQKEKAITHWRKAVVMQDALNYNEPADWYYPIRESLGAALLFAGKANEAERAFRDDLLRNPRNPRSLFGLMNSLKAQQRDADAAWVERQFNEAWKSADTKLSLSGL
jgi:tetratricopeptide (TPR) repeat protein